VPVSSECAHAGPSSSEEARRRIAWLLLLSLPVIVLATGTVLVLAFGATYDTIAWQRWAVPWINMIIVFAVVGVAVKLSRTGELKPLTIGTCLNPLNWWSSVRMLTGWLLASIMLGVTGLIIAQNAYQAATWEATTGTIIEAAVVDEFKQRPGKAPRQRRVGQVKYRYEVADESYVGEGVRRREGLVLYNENQERQFLEEWTIDRAVTVRYAPGEPATATLDFELDWIIGLVFALGWGATLWSYFEARSLGVVEEQDPHAELRETVNYTADRSPR